MGRGAAWAWVRIERWLAARHAYGRGHGIERQRPARHAYGRGTGRAAAPGAARARAWVRIERQRPARRGCGTEGGARRGMGTGYIGGSRRRGRSLTGGRGVERTANERLRVGSDRVQSATRPSPSLPALFPAHFAPFLHRIRCLPGHSPCVRDVHAGAATVIARMMKDLRRARQQRPTLNVGVVQDGAPELWNRMRAALFDEFSFKGRRWGFYLWKRTPWREQSTGTT